MAHKHSIHDTDKHFIVDPASRSIISQSNKVKLIQYDHNSERFTFQVPRYIEGHDMSLCNAIDINYINLSSDRMYQSSGPYRVTDMQISPDGDDVIIFSWLISRNVTMYAGSLNFAISFECATDSVVDYAWHTDVYSEIGIYESVRNDGSEVVMPYNDVLIQWAERLFGEGDSAVQRIKEAEAAALKAIKEAGGSSPDESGTASFEIGDNLIIEDGFLKVKTTDEVSVDNTLPITSAAVYSTVGNISAILDTI